MWVEKYSINTAALTSSHFTQNYSKKGFWAVHSDDSLDLSTRSNLEIPTRKAYRRIHESHELPVPIASMGPLPVQAGCLLCPQTPALAVRSLFPVSQGLLHYGHGRSGRRGEILLSCSEAPTWLLPSLLIQKMSGKTKIARN